ncbi:hypothetical protein H6F96_08695 [Microcoleus sp. FACHB-53]|nr:hypothetical protein [Microcoleus sp. FACHB-53]
MNPQENRLINLAIGESSDPEMLYRDAQSKTGSSPNPESSNSEALTGDADTKTLDDFNYENEEDREAPPDADFDLADEDRVASNQMQIANRHAG